LIDWKLEQAKLEKAAEFGEQITRDADFIAPPIDPFALICNEGGRIKTFGDDFGSNFDGRLEFQRPKFLLFYNTKYNEWSHTGQHHPKVLFTIGHELGHYFLEHHRRFLMGGGGAHGSVTEFQSGRLVEREADSFSSGLLMPKYLLGKIVNRIPPAMKSVKQACSQFQVSLTSMLVRWVQLCDFPCAVASIRHGTIEWGFCSPGFKRAGVFKIKRDAPVSSRAAKAFVGEDASFAVFREGEGCSDVSHWITNDELRVVVTEQYLVIPSTQQMLVFITADEDDVCDGRDYE